ncbi:uncharacterized protein LOC116306861 [Actinia tenebrosa]|uniref:Uncharacterized protein LOC116306861 n=1 Tax=Actinia tenebrosa TaxID=6105 RepID=A0A6P8J684_ACTTE|nr:uncharacterized protein LOC116306861 [Actinia tenebrosa]
MNIQALVFFFAVLLASSKASNDVGNCTFKEYYQNERVCTTAFIHGLQEQPKLSCRPKLEEFFNCTIKVVKGCVKTLDAAGEAAVRADLEKKATENKMCELGGMHFEEPVGPNQTFPCTISKNEYRKQTASCYESFEKMWHKNRNDKGLCSGFATVKKCVQNVMTSKCTITGDFKEKTDLMFDDYNPFCSEKPTSKSTRIKTQALVNIAVVSVLLVLSIIL